MSLKPDEDISNVQQDVDEVLIEEAKAIQSVAHAIFHAGMDLLNRQKSSKITVAIDKNTPERDLWNKYSKDVQGRVPAEKTLAVAKNALRDGQSKEMAVKIILSADPQSEQIKQKQGQQKAQQYAELAVRAAYRKDLVSKQSKQSQRQQQRPQSKGFELER